VQAKQYPLASPALASGLLEAIGMRLLGLRRGLLVYGSMYDGVD
jgi:hypothetical protein